MYQEFEKVSKQKWLQSFDYQKINFEKKYLGISPFSHVDDNQKIEYVIKNKTVFISEKIEAKSNFEKNQEILIALNGGANSITVPVNKIFTKTDFNEIFKGVYFEFIRVDFEFENNQIHEINFFLEFKKYLKEIGQKSSKINISINLNNTIDLNDLFKIIPNLKIRIKNKEIDSINKKYLLDLLIVAENLLEKETSIIQKKISKNLIFELNISNEFYWNIATIETLKILWLNILNSYDIKPFIFIKININTNEVDDPNTAVIAATTQAISALNSGANQIEIDAFKYKNSPEFSKKIARNILNISLFEANLNQNISAINGSYFIDSLTKKNAENIWKAFKNYKKKVL